MTRQLLCGFVIAAGLATAAPWNKVFKGKKKAAAPAAASSAAGQKTATNAKPKKEKAKKQEARKQEKDATGFAGLYVTGSVAAIPQDMGGRLDLSDHQKLQFHYGEPTWSVPYSRIRAIEVADKKPNELWSKVPKLSKRKRVFTIDFDGEKGEKNFLKIEMGLLEALEALPIMEERTGRAVAVAGQIPGIWWGDAVWKTPRNQPGWDEAVQQQQPTKPTVAQKNE